MTWIAYILALTMTTTAYTYTGNKTASGVWPVAGRTAACCLASDKGCQDQNPFGTRVWIEGIGGRVCEDLIGHSSELDIFMDTKGEALRYGRRRVRVWRMGR